MTTWRFCTAALAGLALFACRQEPEQVPQARPTSTQVIPPLPVAEPPLDRSALLLAAFRAASAAAAGQIDLEAQRLLDGKRFELRMRFGCGGPAEDGEEPRRWTFDEQRRILRFRIKPDISADTPLLETLGARDFEAANGFWISRPWLLVATCPAAPPAEPSPAASAPARPSPSRKAASRPATPEPEAEPPRLGIVQIFTDTDPRTHRRDDRAYQATKTLPPDAAPSAVGYDLVVSGRLRRTLEGQVIACALANAPTPPSCMIFAEFDRVALVQPGTGEIISEWSVGG